MSKAPRHCSPHIRRLRLGVAAASASACLAALPAVAQDAGAPAAVSPLRLSLQTRAASAERRALGLRQPGLPAAPRALDLVLQWRPDPVAGRRFDAQLWQRISSDLPPGLDGIDHRPLFGARLEMQLKPRKPFTDLRDLLGVELDNGGRLSLRPNRGKVSIYYKMRF